ncbi:Sodium/hydrogen exchanger 8 [Orchesella cincta]|uniref:Sodium/hydrogen exchanger 8 n=1 Tax=Orchesella cincta TaxID=48709 RepID=A0A1D2N0J6_ORCCI|nr:Sodium/hydrogen exchanger 8 [Orchesella cincta]
MEPQDWFWPDTHGQELGDSGNQNSDVDIRPIVVHSSGGHEIEYDDEAEFRNFCQHQELVRNDPQNETLLKQCSETKPGEFVKDDLIMLFSLGIMMCWGVLVRVVLRRFHLPFPYTVVLMLSGFAFGFLSKHFCDELHSYTAIVRIHPEIILLTFLPVLIFESAFSISVHTFTRSAVSILLVAFPGMLISTFLTSGVCMYFFESYNWTFPQASLFGSVVSATDPVAVVAILRELGAAESLSVMIEGESLLNDGVAVLLYEIFVEIVQEPEMLADWLPLTLHIVTKFCQIAIGGTIFGCFAGKITVFSLNNVYNDPTCEIAITICSAYLTYFIGEELLGVSGIMAVVALGLTLGSERTCISPESEKPVHHFWEMLGYFANTALFVMVGILISEVALVGVTKTDVWYLIGLYFQLTVIRLAMLTLLSPLLSRLGYGMEWKDILVTAFGGLRGAVGLCLALEINENPNLCDKDKLGPKILFHTSGIVFLTLVFNATTTKKLMDVLSMTKITLGSASDMENAYYLLMKTRKTAISAFKSDRFLVGSVWTVVSGSTKIENPYREEIAKAIAEASRAFGKVLSENIGLPLPNTIRNNKVMQDPRLHIMSYQEVHEEARRRIVHMIKSASWKQFQQGLIHADAARALVSHCEKVEDTPLILVSITELAKSWEPGWLLTKISELGTDAKFNCLQTIFQKISQYFIIERIHLAYEISRGFVSSMDTVIKLIPLLPDTPETLEKFKRTLEKERMLIFQELGPLQKLQPGVVQAVKTRITCRTVLNQMREGVKEIKHEGLIDHEEAVVLELELEKQLKEMNAKIPHSLMVAPPISFIHQLGWIDGDEELKTYLVENASFMIFNYGDTIYSLDEPPKGIFVLVNGLVKVEYSPSSSIVESFEQYGAFPNSEVLTDLTFKGKTADILTQGALIGEIGFLKNVPRAATVTCGSYVTAYYFSTTALKTGMSIFGEGENKESLEAKIWRSWGFRVATALLQRLPAYYEWSLEKIQMHLEPSVVPVMDKFETFEIGDNIADVIVIEGYIQNYHTKEVYAAPCLVPRYCTHITSVTGL